MDPALMAFLGSLALSAMNVGGSNGEKGSTYNKEQKGGLNEIMQYIKSKGGPAGTDIENNPSYMQGQNWFNDLFNDENFFNKFESPMIRDYQENIVPDLANRFASQGSGGSLGSTGFRNQLAREGSNLQTNIAAMRGNMQQNAIPQMLQYAQQPASNMMQLYNTALGHPTENTYQGPSNPFAPIAGAGFQGWMLGLGMIQ